MLALYHNFAWAGYISRLSASDPQRATLKVLKFKDHDWLKRVEDKNAGRQLHGRYLRVWRWEYPMSQYAESIGVDSWHQMAANRRDWIENLGIMARWFRINRATKLP